MRTTLRLFLPAASLLLSASVAAAAGVSAQLAAVKGTVVMVVDGKRHPAKALEEVPDGAKLMTGAGSEALLALSDGSKIRIGEDAIFAYEGMTRSDVNLRLLKGKLWGWIMHQGERRLNVRTPSAVASVRGTELTADAYARKTLFELFSGSMWVTDRFGRAGLMEPGHGWEASYAGGLGPMFILPPGAFMPPAPFLPPGMKLGPGGPGKPVKKGPPPPLVTPPPPPPPPPSQEQTVVSPSAP